MKIVLAVDGSAPSERAARHVAKLAKQLAKPPTVLLIHVDPPLLRAAARKLGAEAVAEYHSSNSEHALAGARQLLTRAKVRFDVLATTGDAAAEIAKAATGLHADMIVMGSRGLTRLKSLMLGSVAMRVLARSSLPTTLVD